MHLIPVISQSIYPCTLVQARILCIQGPQRSYGSTSKLYYVRAEEFMPKTEVTI